MHCESRAVKFPASNSAAVCKICLSYYGSSSSADCAEGGLAPRARSVTFSSEGAISSRNAIFLSWELFFHNIQLGSSLYQSRRVYIAKKFYLRCVGIRHPLFRQRPPLNELAAAAAATRACGCDINHTTRATLHMIMQGEGGSGVRAREGQNTSHYYPESRMCLSPPFPCSKEGPGAPSLIKTFSLPPSFHPFLS